MRLRLLLAVALLAVSSASFEAAAQGQGTLTLSLTGPATASVNAGQAHSATFTLGVEASGFQCTQGGTIEIAIALSNAGAAPAGVTPTVEPANVSIQVPPGAHGSPVPGLPVPVGEPINTTATITLRVATTAIAAGMYPATISATHAAGPVAEPPACFGDLPDATATANHQLTIVGQTGGNGTSPPTTPPGSGGNGTGGNGTSPPPPPPSRGLPGFEPLVLAGAAALVAVAARRRR